jgi:membrane protein YqaA with SNARE-associated domain
MSLTPGAGNYVLWFICSTFNSNSSQTNSFSVYVNGVQVTGTLQSIRVPAVNGSVIGSVMTYLTGVLAGQAVEIRWNTTGGTATATNREMILMKVA